MDINIDNHKLIYHPHRVREWIQDRDCYPIYVEIGPTNYCNHRCTFCALDYLEKGTDMIDKGLMVKTLEEMAGKGVKSVMFAGEGEPLLHKDIGLFTQKAKEYGLDVAITTNGVAFTKEKREKSLPNLSWIRFSIDSGEEENYAQIHGTKASDFNKVLANISESVKYRDSHGLNTTIGAQFLMIPQNVDQVGKLAVKLRDLGADNLQIKPYSNHPNSNNNLAIDLGLYNSIESKIKDLSTEKFKIIFRKETVQRLESERNYHECYGLSFFTLIDSGGNVLPCNLYYGNPEYTYGNLYENSFSEIWQGKKRKEVLEKIHGQGVDNCRRGCRLDAINRYLERLKNPGFHDNFL
jgi:GTP 3',8-cyclase